MKFLILASLLVCLAACAPSENITAIKEQAYQSGFEQGRLKGLAEAEQTQKATAWLPGTWQHKPDAPAVKYYNTWETPPHQGTYQDGYNAGQWDAEAHDRQNNPWQSNGNTWNQGPNTTFWDAGYR